MKWGFRRSAAPIVVLLAASLAACAPAMPPTVVAGTAVTVGWTGELTSLNAAAAPTAGNLDIAATIRDDFGDLIDGEFVPDTGFGTVEIVSDDPFTVRFDLAEPAWSDGIPLDAADLLLGWAGASGVLAEEGGDADADLVVPAIDEFARSIDVVLPQPSNTWQQAVTVPVPAHVVGRRAFGVDDPMEAKQAVIRAIQSEDADALDRIAEVWNTGFAMPESGAPASDLLLSSGPYLVSEVETEEGGQSVTLVPNPAYRGVAAPTIAKVELVPPGDDPVAAIGDALDVAQVAPTSANQAPIHELERKDILVETPHDGTMWALLLRPYGVFTQASARTAFLHAAPASALAEGGAGAWAPAYVATTSMVTSPASRAYTIVNEDSGFTETLGSTDGEPALEREAAGIAAGSGVCVLYDRGSEFAVGAFAALRTAVAEAGWSIEDCGSDDYAGALEQGGGWDAVIARTPIPQSPEQIAAQWGSESATAWHGDPDRDELIARLAETTDVYEARELLGQIEASIVRAAVALPIAVNPRVTIADRDVAGVATRDGGVAALTSGIAQWTAVP